MDTGEREVHGWTVVPLAGRLDAHTSPALEQALLARRDASLALDLGAVDYLSSAGLRVLLAVLKAARARQGRVCLLCPRPNVQEVLEISGFTTLFEIRGDEADLAS